MSPTAPGHGEHDGAAPQAASKGPPPQLGRLDLDNCFVARGHGGAEGPAGRCRLKLRCVTCACEAIELPVGQTLQTLLPTFGDLARYMHDRIPGTVCYNHDTDEHDGLLGCDCAKIVAECDGFPSGEGAPLEEPHFLFQVVAAEPGERCAVSHEEPDDGKLIRFDPCGHKISLGSFIEHARREISGGRHGKRLAKSDITGQFAVACPLAGELCSKSLVHDLNHYRMLGADEHGVQYYDRIKGFAVIEQIQETTCRAQIFECPRCGSQGVKDGGCMFATCPSCGGEFCYWCGAASDDHVCPNRCGPTFLTEAKLSNGIEFSDRGQVALQEYHVWRLKSMLKALCDKVGVEVFRMALQDDPGALEGLFGDDCAGMRGESEPIAGVTVKLEDVISYTHVTVVGKVSAEARCDPFRDAGHCRR